MTEHQVRERVRAVVAAELGLAAGAVHDGLAPGDVPSWDSIGHLQVIRAIERAFDVRFTIEQVMSFNTVADLGALVARLAGESAGD